MRLTLAKKIIAPYALLGVLVLILLSVLFAFDERRAAMAAQERALVEVGAAVREISARVQTGILTRDEALAIEVARLALSVEESLARLGPRGDALRAPFQDYFAAMVGINSVYLENRVDEGARRLGQLRAQERDIDAAIAAQLAEAAGQRRGLKQLAQSFQIGVLVVILVTLGLVALLVVRRVVRPLERAVHVAEAIAAGDLSGTIDSGGQDEVGDLLRALGTMQSELSRLLAGIQDVVGQATRGDFEHLIDTSQQQGVARELGELINQMTAITRAGLHDVMRVTDALARGDLDQRIERDDPGIFGETQRGVNATVDTLRATVEEIRVLVDAAAQGEFGERLQTAGKAGVFLHIAEGLNALSGRVSAGLEDVARVLQAMASRDLTQLPAGHRPGRGDRHGERRAERRRGGSLTRARRHG